jgi:hypothetical protein
MGRKQRDNTVEELVDITYLDKTDSICLFWSFQTSTPYFSISSRFSILQYQLCFKTYNSLLGNRIVTTIPSSLLQGMEVSRFEV